MFYDFFHTIYGWTSFLYSDALDTYLYSGGDGSAFGYPTLGIVMIILSALAAVAYYYVLCPVRHKYRWYFLVFGISALLNFCYSLYYTASPLVNNEIAAADEWGTLDCILFGVSDILWGAVAYAVVSLLIKWWSINKYIPFKRF